MISPDCYLIVTKGSALLISAMKMVPTPSSGCLKWNVRPIGYYLEMLPNFLPLASYKCPQASEVGVLAATADGNEGFRVIYLFVSSASLLLCMHAAGVASPTKNKLLHLPFSITGKFLPLQLSVTFLTCFELPSFPSEASSQLLCSFIYSLK